MKIKIGFISSNGKPDLELPSFAAGVQIHGEESTGLYPVKKITSVHANDKRVYVIAEAMDDDKPVLEPETKLYVDEQLPTEAPAVVLLPEIAPVIHEAPEPSEYL